jgi:PAS domain S-box-containing protein
MMSYLSALLSPVDYIPHGICLLWQPELIALHVGSDAAIASAYYSIPFALIYFVSKRTDLAFPSIFVLTGAFILACGTTHVMSIVTLWQPDYRLEGIIKLITALVSVTTAFAMWQTMPLALALPSTAQLEQANRSLAEEIAERKRAQAALRLVVEAAPNAMVMIDRSGKIVMVNTQAERIFGYSRAELVGQPVEMLVPERLRSHHPELRTTFFADLRPRPMGAGRDLYGLKKDGSEFPVEIGLNPIETDEGTMVLSAIVDITARKAAELALRESEQRYSVLVDGVTDYAIYMIDPNGIVTNWNRGAQRIKGYRTEEIVGQHFSCFFTEEDRAANVPQQALEIAARDSWYEAEAWHVRKDGSRFVANVVIDALRNDSGRLIGFAKITRDITERVQRARELEEARISLLQSRAEEALRRAQAELAHVARVTTLGEMSASISHELNQPLAGILTNAEACLLWLDRETPDLDRARSSVEWIIKDGNRAGEVIRRVRGLMQKSDTQKAPLDINHVISEVIPLMQLELDSHRVALRMELAPALPVILADRVGLQQVIINLVMNGIDAMEPITDRPRELVIGSRHDKADQILVTVEDCGVGISAENADRLFSPFFTTKSGGMGMGLRICRSIIESYGGRMSATNNSRPGATFQFTLPLHQEDRS